MTNEGSKGSVTLLWPHTYTHMYWATCMQHKNSLSHTHRQVLKWHTGLRSTPEILKAGARCTLLSQRFMFVFNTTRHYTALIDQNQGQCRSTCFWYLWPVLCYCVQQSLFRRKQVCTLLKKGREKGVERRCINVIAMNCHYSDKILGVINAPSVLVLVVNKEPTGCWNPVISQR